MDHKERAKYFHKKYGNDAISVVNEIIKFSPNKPNVYDTKYYFMCVKEEIKELRKLDKDLKKPKIFGIIVDKSKTTKTYPLRGTAFPKESGLNYDRE